MTNWNAVTLTWMFISKKLSLTDFTTNTAVEFSPLFWLLRKAGQSPWTSHHLNVSVYLCACAVSEAPSHRVWKGRCFAVVLFIPYYQLSFAGQLSRGFPRTAVYCGHSSLFRLEVVWLQGRAALSLSSSFSLCVWGKKVCLVTPDFPRWWNHFLMCSGSVGHWATVKSKQMVKLAKSICHTCSVIECTGRWWLLMYLVSVLFWVLLL